MGASLDVILRGTGISNEALAGVGLQFPTATQLPTSKPATSPAACQRHGMPLLHDEPSAPVAAALPPLAAEVIASAGRGWRLFPVKAGQKAPPSLTDWPVKATCDTNCLEGWARKFPGANWALACGPDSGVYVLDIDGPDGQSSVAAWERRGWKLPVTRTHKTPRGLHLLFKWPVGFAFTISAGKLGAGLDERGDHGYILIPPSLHPSGHRYICEDESGPLADVPQWLIDLHHQRPAQPVATANGEAVSKGNRTNTLVSLAGTMNKRGMSLEAITAALNVVNSEKCDPPLPEAKVKNIAADIAKRYPAGAAQAGNGLKLTALGELLSRPVVPVDYVWQERLVSGCVSIVASKPKVGKSTLARNLALSIARGEPFLGWPVKRGPVLYLALEERGEDVAADFRAMGADGSEDIQIADSATVLDVVSILQDKRPVLVVVDPLFLLVRIQDANAYAETYQALGPLIDVARQTGTHILCLHHSSKLAKAEAIDTPIGSTALGGAVSTLLAMRRTESYRTICSVQRIGKDLPETVLQFDAATKRLSLGGSREGVEVANVGAAIMEALADKSLTEPEIGDVVEGKNTLKRKALRELTGQGKIARSGSGKRGDPYLYGKGSTLVPTPIEKTGYKKPLEGVSEALNREEKKVVPVFHNSMGYKGTSNSNDPEKVVNIEEKLVPAYMGIPLNSEKPGTSNLAEIRI